MKSNKKILLNQFIIMDTYFLYYYSIIFFFRRDKYKIDKFLRSRTNSFIPRIYKYQELVVKIKLQTTYVIKIMIERY